MATVLSPERLETITFQVTIPDIHCPECAWLLQLRLEAFKGVVRADVDRESSTATISYRRGSVCREEILRAIRSSGYEVA